MIAHIGPISKMDAALSVRCRFRFSVMALLPLARVVGYNHPVAPSVLRLLASRIVAAAVLPAQFGHGV